MNERSASRSPLPAPAAAPPGRAILRRQCACGNHTVGGEECEQCKQRRGSLQRAARGPAAAAAAAPPIVHQVLGTPGEPLKPAARADMEPRFQHDFSAVRVHGDGRAAESAAAVGALAYTVGSHVVFGARQYRPESAAGRRLLAHELAHVVQQRGAALQPRLAVGPADTPEERQAESCARAVAAGQSPPALAAAGALVQRAEELEEDTGQGGEAAEPAADDEREAEVHDGEEPAGSGTVAVGELSDAQQGLDEEAEEETLPAAGPAGSEADQPVELKGGPQAGKGKGKGKAPPGGGKPAKPEITHIEVSLAQQQLQVTWSDGKKESAQVSTGKGCPNTKEDPCADTASWACTEAGNFTIGKKGDGDYKNQHGDKMSWYVELDASRGIGIHDSQEVTGRPASHGCIRTGPDMARRINQNVTSKTTVHVGGKAPTKPWTQAKMGSYKGHCPDPPQPKPKPKKAAPAKKK